MDIYQEISKMREVQEETLNLLKSIRNNGVVDKDKVYDLTDVENILHVSRRSIFKWKSEGKMKFSQIGKKLYITNSELKRFLEANKQD